MVAELLKLVIIAAPRALHGVPGCRGDCLCCGGKVLRAYFTKSGVVGATVESEGRVLVIDWRGLNVRDYEACLTASLAQVSRGARVLILDTSKVHDKAQRAALTAVEARWWPRLERYGLEAVISVLPKSKSRCESWRVVTASPYALDCIEACTMDDAQHAASKYL